MEALFFNLTQTQRTEGWTWRLKEACARELGSPAPRGKPSAVVHPYVLPAVPSDHTHLAQSVAGPPGAADPPKSLSQRRVYISVGRLGTLVF